MTLSPCQACGAHPARAGALDRVISAALVGLVAGWITASLFLTPINPTTPATPAGRATRR